MREIAPGIVVDPAIKGGKPLIKGTRISVELILGRLASGMSYDELAVEYEITKEQILATLKYAALALSEEEIRVVQ